MSTRERNRYVTAAAAFLIAFGILGLLLLRSIWVTAQILDFTWRPQAATTHTYVGGNLTDCGSDVTISSTQRLGFAFDKNLVTAATTYTDADIFGDGLQTPDTGFTESGKWSSFQQTTTFITDADLLVRIAGINNLANQWKIEYTVEGPTAADSAWNEMVRFTIGYVDDPDDTGLVAGDEILLFIGGDTTQPYDDVGYVVSKDTTANTLVLERYYPGQFTSWSVSDAIENLGVGGSPPTFSTTISSASLINDNPPTGTVLGQVLASDANRAFLTDDSSDPNYILDSLSTDLAVRILTRQQGCSTDGVDTCPLCGSDPAGLAKLNIYDIQVEADWNTMTGGEAPLTIATESLPDANKYSSYDESLVAYGGNIGTGGYVWEITSGSLPPEFSSANTGSPNYDLRITYSGSTPYTVPGTYNFTVKVSDESVPVQTAQKPLSIHIAGLAIDPPGPDLAPAVKGTAYSQAFTAQGGSSPYTWCIVSGTIPPGLSLADACPSASTTGSSISFSGTPTNAGSYGFTLRLTDSSGNEEPAEQYYRVDVSTTGVEIIKKLLKPMVKKIKYSNDPATGATYQRMEAQSLAAVRAIYSTNVSQVTWSSTGLPSGLSLADKTLDTVDKISRVYIVGTIPIDETAADYPFTATVDDNGADSDSEADLVLRVLERKTLLLKAPPSSVQLPSDHKLKFVVFAEGGAPSNGVADTALDGSSLPYYDYAWQVTPVPNTDSPALATSSGTGVPATPSAQPYTLSITFNDAAGNPVTGTYDVTFWAQDYLRRTNASNPDYEFVPATVRLKVNVPEAVEKRPIKLRQEQFR